MDTADTSVVMAKAYEPADVVRASIDLGQGNILLHRYKIIPLFGFSCNDRVFVIWNASQPLVGTTCSSVSRVCWK